MRRERRPLWAPLFFNCKGFVFLGMFRVMSWPHQTIWFALILGSVACSGASKPDQAKANTGDVKAQQTDDAVAVNRANKQSRFEKLGPGPGQDGYFPLKRSRQLDGVLSNREAPIPVQCYTKTNGESNPCWVCHTKSVFPNLKSDEDLQAEYSFSEAGLTNHWANLFVDRSDAIASISDAESLSYIRADNYTPLAAVMKGNTTEWGYQFDLDFSKGFDEQGFARDGSGWRAFRYKPFPGTFWPTNGSTDDVMIRLPAKFRSLDSKASSEVYKANLAILEASLASDPSIEPDQVRWPTELLDENEIGRDLDGDGKLSTVNMIAGLPKTYVGDAESHLVTRRLYPAQTEFLHSVRYIDPEAESLIARRMKELRYSRKEEEIGRGFYTAFYEHSADEKEKGMLPYYGGNSETGLRNEFRWRFQGYIEDEKGRLRLQTLEEHYFCMGCHGGIGVTVDNTFAFPRKVPGEQGWGYQSVTDIPDVPQLGHEEPETLTYFRRVGGGDELRANREVLERFFEDGKVREAEVTRAAPGGDRALPHLIAPSKGRALELNKAYMALVKSQTFDKGRDTVLSPPQHVHRTIENGSTELARENKLFEDGTLLLDWRKTKFWELDDAAPRTN